MYHFIHGPRPAELLAACGNFLENNFYRTQTHTHTHTHTHGRTGDVVCADSAATVRIGLPALFTVTLNLPDSNIPCCNVCMSRRQYMDKVITQLTDRPENADSWLQRPTSP